MNRIARFALASMGAGAVLIAAAAPAWAHVTVTAPGATSGGSDQEITFRVPVEKNADTVGLTIQLPTATPIASVLVDPLDGWTHTQKTSKLTKPITTDDGTITEAVSQITWKATGSGLKPGEFGEFTIIAGQLPKAKQLVFKALQTYSDGSVVSWIQTPAPGSTEEPDFPAPTLTLGATSAADSDATPTVSATPAASSSGSSASSSSDTGAIVLSIVALVIAVGAVAFGVVSRAKAKGSTS